LSMSGNGNTIISLIKRLLQEDAIQDLVMMALYSVHKDQFEDDKTNIN